MLTANYLTDNLALRPEFQDEMSRGDMSAPDIICTGSHVSVEMFSRIGGYMSLPGYYERFNPWQKNVD